jgi:hypothetical protein
MSKSPRKSGFLSYAHEDRAYADRLHTDLSARGLRIWYDVNDFDGNQDVDEQILNAIQETYFVLLLLSPTSVSKDGYVRKEIQHAIEVARKLSPHNSFLIPVRVAECNPLEAELQGLDTSIDLFTDWERGIQQIDKLIPYQNDPLDIENLSIHEIQNDLADLAYLERATIHFGFRSALGVFLRNCLQVLESHDESMLSRKHEQINNSLSDFCSCMELHFVHGCGAQDEKTTCHKCNAAGSIIHGTDDVGGFTPSDYNDNYVVLCTACFWSYYDFEIDYLGTGPLKFNYKTNVYV